MTRKVMNTHHTTIMKEKNYGSGTEFSDRNTGIKN